MSPTIIILLAAWLGLNVAFVAVAIVPSLRIVAPAKRLLPSDIRGSSTKHLLSGDAQMILVAHSRSCSIILSSEDQLHKSSSVIWRG